VHNTNCREPREKPTHRTFANDRYLRRPGCSRHRHDVASWWLLTNVTLIDVSSEPIEAITEARHSGEGQEHTVEAIVFATGRDAMTGALLKVDIRGTGGSTLK
jgi:hypothetical protein